MDYVSFQDFVVQHPAAAFFLMLVFGVTLTACLVLFFVYLIQIAERREDLRLFGLILGFIYAICANASWIIVPYLGAYLSLPNLPLILLLVVFDPSDQWKVPIVLAMNFVYWPLVGWLADHILGRISRPLPRVAGPGRGYEEII